MGLVFKVCKIAFCQGLVLLMGGMFAAANGSGGEHLQRLTAAPQDTVTVEGEVVTVGHEPFTRQKVIQKGGGGYLLEFSGKQKIKLSRQGPTRVRVTGVPYQEVWQGKESSFLRVTDWEYLNR